MSWIELVAQRRPPKIPQGVTPPENAADWYRIENAADETDATDIYVYDAIGGWFGMYADEFISDLKEVTSRNVNLRLNSPGGSVFEGIAIANAIRSHPSNFTVYVDGLAASIASVIALAGDKLVMMPQSQLMIHDASGACYGNAEDMEYMVGLLNKQSDNIADAYADRAGGTPTAWRDLMKAETWYSAKEAVAAGLADEVMTPPKKSNGDESAEACTPVYPRMQAAWDLSAYKYDGRDKAPDPVPFAAGGVITAAVTNAVELKPGEPVVRLDALSDMTRDGLMDLIREAVRAELPVALAATPPAPAEDDPEDASSTPPFLKPDEEEEEDEPEDAAVPEDEPEDEPEASAAEDTGPGDEEATAESTAPHDEVDEWNSLVGRLTESPSPSADDVFNRLKGAWL